MTRWGLIGLLLAFLWPAAALAQDDPCADGNLIWNCRFDTFSGSPPRQIPAGWNAFVLAGDLTFMQDEDTFFGAPSLRMWSNGGTFTAGIWTQVSVQPGATYEASWGWGGPNAPDTFGRKLGIDPTGGVDPTSRNVVWGPLHYGPGRILNRPGPYSPGNPNLNVAVPAQGSTVTVFVWVEHPISTGDNLIFIDQVGLRQTSAAIVPTATPTAPPPAATPIPTATSAVVLAPTATAIPTTAVTDTPTATPSPTSTATPTATATATATASPTATPSPTLTPTASPTLAARPTATPLPLLDQLAQTGRQQPRWLLYSSFGSLGAAVLAGVSLVALLRAKKESQS